MTTPTPIANAMKKKETRTNLDRQRGYEKAKAIPMADAKLVRELLAGLKPNLAGEFAK